MSLRRKLKYRTQQLVNISDSQPHLSRLASTEESLFSQESVLSEVSESGEIFFSSNAFPSPGTKQDLTNQKTVKIQRQRLKDRNWEIPLSSNAFSSPDSSVLLDSICRLHVVSSHSATRSKKSKIWIWSPTLSILQNMRKGFGWKLQEKNDVSETWKHLTNLVKEPGGFPWFFLLKENYCRWTRGHPGGLLPSEWQLKVLTPRY